MPALPYTLTITWTVGDALVLSYPDLQPWEAAPFSRRRSSRPSPTSAPTPEIDLTNRRETLTRPSETISAVVGSI